MDGTDWYDIFSQDSADEEGNKGISNDDTPAAAEAAACIALQQLPCNNSDGDGIPTNREGSVPTPTDDDHGKDAEDPPSTTESVPVGLEDVLDLSDAGIKVAWPSGYDALRARQTVSRAAPAVSFLATSATAVCLESTTAVFSATPSYT